MDIWNWMLENLRRCKKSSKMGTNELVLRTTIPAGTWCQLKYYLGDNTVDKLYRLSHRSSWNR